MNNSEMIDEMADRIEKLEQQVMLLKAAIDLIAVAIGELRGRIEKLETRAVLNADEEQRLQVVANVATLTEQIGLLRALRLQVASQVTLATVAERRIEKLEAALREVTRCLIDGRVSVAGAVPGELHGHRILGTESVQAMIGVYHRLKE